ncbi:MAG: response regulator [Methanomassiliicoccus sp.]|nr:response regulator [Methanomassiliicoccus sp.]
MSVNNILLVEDDVAFARFLIGCFRDVSPGLEMFHVNSGHAAMSVIHSGFVPDLIICEERMPRMGGAELLSNVRMSPSLQSAPFYLFSSSWTDDAQAAQKHALEVRVPRPRNYREGLALAGRVLSSLSPETPVIGAEQAVTI